MKDKKISVRFFINTNYKPFHKPLFKDSNFYPVYVQVTYNRKNTQFKSFHNETYQTIEDAFSQSGELLKFEEAMIRMVVEYGVKTEGKNFNLNDLRKKCIIYIMSKLTVCLFYPELYRIKKEMKQHVIDAINAYNPEYFKIHKLPEDDTYI